MRHGRGTTVYLLSGLTVPERRAALRRLRVSARMGHCPRLPAGQLVLALVADRIRTGAGRAGAIFRSHPAGSTVPVMVVSAAVAAFLLLSTVSGPAGSGRRGPGIGPSAPGRSGADDSLVFIAPARFGFELSAWTGGAPAVPLR